MDLSAEEIRVLGCLIEKQMTTPDYYPMTQNAIQNACNQSTNRDPVVDFGDGTVIQALNDLRDHGLARALHSPGARAVKYRHVLDEALDLQPPDLPLLAVLMLRGDQTAGELRTRTTRYREYSGPAEVTTRLEGLAAREQPLVSRLERRPGEKEPRWRHLLGAAGGRAPMTAEDWAPDPAHDEVAELRAEVAELRARVNALAELLGVDQ